MSLDRKKPVLLSGIQPTGNLMIGNYIGAMQNWVKLQEECDCLFVLVDLHAITARPNPSELLRRSYEFIALYIACGIDPAKSTIFVQSHVPGHAQLAWILNCFTYMGELNRMTQFKDKALRQPENLNVGLFDYPVLMASDILLYGANLVPVGVDQKQHLELARNIAQRFNSEFGKIFTIPEIYMPKVGAKILGLQNSAAKMSKTNRNASNYIALLDPPEGVKKKIKRAITDSGTEVEYHESKPGISNLMVIYSAITGKSLTGIQQDYAGQGYGRFKNDLAEIIIEFLQPIQKRYEVFSNDRDFLASTLKRGAEAARERSQHTLDAVHRALGFIPEGAHE